MHRLVVHSNVIRFETTRFPDVDLVHRPLPDGDGLLGAFRAWRAATRERADVLMVSTDVPRLMRLCALSVVLPRRFRLVSLDIVLGEPRTAWQRVLARVKKFLLRQVDQFIVFQHDLGGYDRYYGVSPRRSVTVPFKANVWERERQAPLSIGDDGHLLFVGRTYRDVPTFLQAVARAGVPCAMVRHAQHATAHGTDFSVGERPPSLREIVHDGSHESWLELIANSRGIVLAIQPGVICAAGISTLLDAFVLGKPVVISDCPATRGFVGEGEVALVPPGDVEALATALRRVSEDEDYRASLVAHGRQVATRVQGEARLYRDVVSILVSGRPAPADRPVAEPVVAGA
jgi:glycosyltransferase involved in cell wall biosynthesis